MNLNKIALATIALVCLFSLTVPAVAAEDKALYGSWEGNFLGRFVYKYAENGKLTLTMILGDDDPPIIFEGTYTTNDGKITMKLPTEEGGELDRVIKGTYEIKGEIMTLTADGIPIRLKKIQE